MRDRRALARALGHPGALAAAVFVAGVLLSATAAVRQRSDDDAIAQRHFTALAREVIGGLSDRLHLYRYGLLGARGAVLACGPASMSRARFERYCRSRDIAQEFPGARGIGVIWRVRPADERSFAETVRGGGAPDFEVHGFAPHAGDRYVITYVEPLSRNQQALGLDIASEPNRRVAAEAAVRSGQATISAPITLVQAGALPLRSFLLLLPIDRPGSSPDTEAQREAANIGWTFAPLVIDEVLADLNRGDPRFGLTLRDRGASATPFFAGPDASAPAARGVAQRTVMSIYGRQWEADLRAREAFIDGLHLADPRRVFGVGALGSALFAALACLLAQSARRGRQVRDEQARRAAIVDSSADAIIGESPEGLVTDWNPGAERLFGLRAAEVIGRPLVRLLPDGRQAEDLEIRAAIGRGELVAAFDTVRRHRDGAPLDVSVSAAPIVGADGRCIGLAMTVRDISAARRAARELRGLNAGLEDQVAHRTALLEAARHDLEAILDAVPTAIAYWDRSLHNRFANQAYRRWFGWGGGSEADGHIRELLGDGVDDPEARFAAVLGGEAKVCEVASSAPGGGEARHALTHYLPDRVDSEVRGFHVVVQDVTQSTRDRARLAAAVRANEALLSTINEQFIVSVADRRGVIVEVNDTFCAISGYARDELVGRDHRVVNSGVHDHAFWVEMWRAISSGRSWRAQICNRAKDGSLYWVDSVIAPFVGADGRIEKYISVRTDVTAARLAERKLRASEAVLDRTGAIAGVGGWELDLATDAVTWTTQTYRLYEVEPGTPVDLACAIDRFPPEARPTLVAAVERCVAHGTGYDLELPFVTAAGRERWVRAIGSAELRDGRAVRLVGAILDITERKRSDAMLQRANERFNIAAESADIGVWEWVPDTNALIWDERMYRIYGRERSAGLEPYSLWSSSVHPDDRPGAEAALQAALRGERDYDVEFRVAWPGGEVRHVKGTALVERDAAGRPLRLTGVNIDVTERKRAELELRATSSMLRTVLESASEVSIIATDLELNITVFNRGAERLLGYRASEIVGRATPVLIHDGEEIRARGEELGAQLGRPVEGGAVFTEPSTFGRPREWTYVRKDGSGVQVSLVVTAMHTADGRPFGYLGIAQDVTSQKAYEASLREAMRSATDASLAKSQFLANMSHEIRTPMNAVLGLAYLLGETPLDAQQSDFLGKLRVASRALLVVINDVLDLSKIEAGELTLERARFGLRGVLHDLHELMSVQAEARSIGLTVDAPDDLPEVLEGDATRLQQVLTNLVSNAIKFTDRGGVSLTVRRLSDGVERVRLRFSVKDTGIGIAPEDQTRLFTPFAQADASTTRRFGGTGLGLSIVKRVVTLMGGEVGLSSAPGEGSEFWIEVDFATATAAGSTPPSTPPPHGGAGLRGVRVLVTDDSDINLEVARRILELEGATVALARNGQEAVDALRARPGAFDVVLMDVQMPVLDGHEATRRIRGELGLTALPVIALTAGALTSEHQRAVAAGMDDFVSKPFDVRRLVRTIRRHLRSTVAAPVAVTEPEAVDGGWWPEIEGIDSADVRGRLGGDTALFCSMLRRLLEEFSDLDSRGDGGVVDAGGLRALATRAHKLRGCAGMLGAKTLSRLAEQTEAACRAGAVEQAAHSIKQVATQLRRLRQAAEPALDQLGGRADEPAPSGAPTELDPGRLRELIGLLSQQNLGALACFEALASQLRHHLGEAPYQRLRGQVDGLQFAQAMDALLAVAP